jgi:hypothetical protein
VIAVQINSAGMFAPSPSPGEGAACAHLACAAGFVVARVSGGRDPYAGHRNGGRPPSVKSWHTPSKREGVLFRWVANCDGCQASNDNRRQSSFTGRRSMSYQVICSVVPQPNRPRSSPSDGTVCKSGPFIAARDAIQEACRIRREMPEYATEIWLDDKRFMDNVSIGQLCQGAR